MAKPKHGFEATGKFCRQCLDLQHRRPRVGLCRCGKAWGPDVIVMSADDRAPGNLARHIRVEYHYRQVEVSHV